MLWRAVARAHGGQADGAAELLARVGASAPSRAGRRGAADAQKNFAALVAAAIPEHARGKPIELWWQDEARIGQQGSLTYIWADKGSRPRAPRDQRYDWAYLFGAVCPRAWGGRRSGAAVRQPRGDEPASGRDQHPGLAGCATLSSTLDGQVGTRLAAHSTARQHQPAAAAALFAGAQPGGEHLAVPAPELPRQPRLRWLHAIVDACCDAWNALIAAPDTIRSIATREWAKTVTR